MSAKSSDRFIPWYVVIFFVAQAMLYAWFVNIAHRSYPGMVTERAYEKGLQYNTVISKAKLQEELGWKTVITTAFSESGDARIMATLADRDGNPISGAQVALWLVRPAREGLDIKTVMRPTGKGIYTAVSALPARGLWEVRILAEKDGHSHQSSKRTEF